MSGVAKVLLREPEVAREPVFVARGRFSEWKGMWPVHFEQKLRWHACGPSFCVARL